MSEKIIAALATFIIGVISAGGYAGVALLMGIESACIPLPSEIIMPFAGYVLGTTMAKLILVATAGAIGCNLGSIPPYWLGRWGGRPAVERFGRFILLNRHDLDLTEHFFQKYGGLTVLAGRLLPVVRTFIALPAGIAKMPQLRFHVYTFLGSWPWCFTLAYIGMRLGASWNSNPQFKAIFHRFHLGVELVLLAGILWFITSHWKNRIRTEIA
ncbi:DedA family protein [Tunturiibacter gelidiferens]|uniref:DedA family protein n=1 Tax=Tunturiibacter gelidiferens TaxID=3069689 RepID=UPI003D9B5EFA